MSLCRAGYRRVAAIAALVGMLAVTSCTTGGGSGTGSGSSGGSAGAAGYKLDTANEVTAEISAADGGSLDVPMDDAKARVIFPNEALAATTTIVATPLSEAPAGEGDVVVKGFNLEEKGTGAGPKLAYPAWVVIAVTDKLGDDVALVSYKDDGSYEVLPTKVTAGANGTVLTGLATHFSPVGGRKVGTAAANNARKQFADFDWVVHIRDTQSLTTGPMKQSITLTLRAVNTGGDIDGHYTGSATIKTKNDMSQGGGTIAAPFTGKSDSVDLTVIVGTLTPLTPPSTTDQGIPLAPLAPEPDWSGGGTIKMTAMQAGGTGTVKARGYSVSKSVKNSESVPVELLMWGPQVSLTANLPVGAVTFRGYIRGEGKK